MKKVIMLVAMLLTITACNSGNDVADQLEPDTFSKQDMAIYKVDNTKGRVSYGMSRKDAEKVLGTGDEATTNTYTYDSGVGVLYRDDKVVAITLKRESQGVYRTARGAEIGMSTTRITELYGEKHAINGTGNYQEYHYDTETGQFLDEAALLQNPGSKEALRARHIFSAAYDGDNNAIELFLIDGLAARTLK
ncbi:hypothetical protein [Paenibacillus donghaensis]|uniref:hypothetical protein n=1 Tax=Paenibacillus donghaensis TaxID=414771 RepID=UPI0012FE40D3|nr:hypothetical protein [Paenibacillus donghaensis]